MTEITFKGHDDGQVYKVCSPDEFDDFSEVDSTTVDSAKGAPS